MESRIRIKQVELWESEPLVIVARIVTAAGVLVTQAMVESVSIQVFDLDSSDPTLSVYTDSPIDPTTVFYDTLQYDYENLLGDPGGYNFRLVLDADTFSLNGGKTYRVQIVSTIGASSHVQVYSVKVGEVW